MSILFVETSALLRILFQEPGYEEPLEKMNAAQRLLASRLIRVEAERAVLRQTYSLKSERTKIRYELQNNLRQIWPMFDFVEVTKEICDLAGNIAPETLLRSLDAIHLATFKWIQAKAPGTEILCYDKRILDAV